MTHPDFNEAVWIGRLAAALEQVAAEARPFYSPIPPALPGPRPIGEYWSALHRGYRALAARAKHDPAASIRFKDSRLWIEKDPAEAMTILREHPLMKSGLEGSGKNEGIRLRILNEMHRPDLKSLVSCLAKLSVKEGGEEAARRLHRYLTAGANGAIPACEITVIHGLVVKTRFNLDAGAYLVPYGDARAEFGLPDEPEPMSKTSYPDAAVLVRSLEYGPGVAPTNDDAALDDVQVSYRFPVEYRVDLESWFGDSKLLVDLLSIAKRVPLLSRTRYVRLARWIEEIDPSFAHGTEDSSGFVSDVWPQRGRELSEGDRCRTASNLPRKPPENRRKTAGRPLAKLSENRWKTVGKTAGKPLVKLLENRRRTGVEPLEKLSAKPPEDHWQNRRKTTGKTAGRPPEDRRKTAGRPLAKPPGDQWQNCRQTARKPPGKAPFLGHFCQSQ